MDNQISNNINTAPSEEARNPVTQPPKKALQPLTILLAILIGVVALQTLQLNSLAGAIKSGAVTTQSANQQGAGSFLNTLKSQVGGCGG